MVSKCRILIMTFLITVTTVTVCNGGQSGTQKNVKPEFKEIKPGPFNPPIRFEAIKGIEKKTVPVVPVKGGGPLLRFSRKGSILKGKHTIKGKVFTSSANVFKFKPEDGSEIMIGYSLPENFRLNRIDNIDGILNLNDKSSLMGADFTATINAGRSILLGSIWKVSKKPIVFKPVNGITLSQIPLPLNEKPRGDGMVTASVSVKTDEGDKNVPMGKVFNFTKEGRKYSVYVHTSIFQNTSDEGDDTRTGYILRAVIKEN